MSEEQKGLVSRGLDALKNVGKQIEDNLHLVPDAQTQHQHNKIQASHNLKSEQHLQKEGVLPKVEIENHTSPKPFLGKVNASKEWLDQVNADRKNAPQHEPLSRKPGAHSPRPIEGIKDEYVTGHGEKPHTHTRSAAAQETHNSSKSHEVRQESAPVSERKVPQSTPEIHSSKPAVKANMDGNAFLDKLEQFGVKVSRSAGLDNQHGPSPAETPKTHVEAGHNNSPYVQLKNTPKHISQEGHKGGAEVPPKPVVREHVDTTKEPTVVKEQAPVKPQTHVEAPHDPKPEASTFRSGVGKTLGGGLSVLGIVGGVGEVKQGVQLLKEGKNLEGTVNLTAGTADITSGTAGLLYTMGRTGLGTIAGKAGGIGSIASGIGDGIQGIQNRDAEKGVEATVKIGLGAGTLIRAASPYATAGLVGWSTGRMIGTHVGWGGENIDTKVTRGIDSHLNAQTNNEYNAIGKKNEDLLSKQQGIIGKDAARLEAEGTTRKDVSEAVLGLREKIERSRNNGEDTQEMQAQVKQLMEARSHLSH